MGLRFLCLDGGLPPEFCGFGSLKVNSKVPPIVRVCGGTPGTVRAQGNPGKMVGQRNGGPPGLAAQIPAEVEAYLLSQVTSASTFGITMPQRTRGRRERSFCAPAGTPVWT